MRTGFGIILENKVLGREYKKDLAQGMEQGFIQGRAFVVRNLLLKRFGKIPGWAEAKLLKANANGLDLWGDRLLDSKTIRQVFET